MYAKCGCTKEARLILDKMTSSANVIGFDTFRFNFKGYFNISWILPKVTFMFQSFTIHKSSFCRELSINFPSGQILVDWWREYVYIGMDVSIYISITSQSKLDISHYIYPLYLFHSIQYSGTCSNMKYFSFQATYEFSKTKSSLISLMPIQKYLQTHFKQYLSTQSLKTWFA